MTDVKDLIQARKNIKSTLTRMETYNNEHDTMESAEVTVRQEKLKELWDKFDKVQTSLEELNPNKFGNADRNNFECQYFKIMTKLETYCPRQTQSIRSSNRQSVDSNNSMMQGKTNLPKLHIPVFNGDYREWRNFHDLYVSIIHDNDNITPIQKLNYLKGSLKDEAQKIIQSVPQSGDNYNEAWKLLVERYENKQFNMNIHLGAILEQPSIIKDSVAGLRSLITETKQHLAALKSLQLPVDQWDVIIIYLVSKKLDTVTRREWELTKNKNDIPTLRSFYEFLDKRCTALELMQGPSDKDRRTQTKNFLVNYKSNVTQNCKLCKGKQHPLYLCETFVNATVDQRLKAVKSIGVCYNCLRSGHSVKDCRSKFCSKCNKKHNTMLHNESRGQETSQSSFKSGKQNDNDARRESEDSSTVPMTHHAVHQSTEVLLSTVVIKVKDQYGNWKECRALLDSGSQCNFATSKLLKQLNIQPRKEELPIKGINEIQTGAQSTAVLQIASATNKYNRNLEFWILDCITSSLPQHHFNTQAWNIPANLKLGDPTFNTPREVDMLLGAEIFFNILRQGKINLGRNLPTMHNTAFGWILSGNLAIDHVTSKSTFFVSNDTLEKKLTRFWEMENVSVEKPQTKEEKACEKHFKDTVRRNAEGRYVVKLPLKDNESSLGDSYQEALKQFLRLEKRFNRNPELHLQYCTFLEEYHKLNHMELVKEPNAASRTCYLPHHPIIKESSSTTKLRVVFNASMKTSSGISLNDIQMIGPVVYEELFSIIMRFRCYKIAMTADVVKMYRQILIDDDDCDLQRILWRKHENENVQVYRLKTVTYGTASAPYLATKCIQQLADDEEMSVETRHAIKHNFYVDDFLGGADTFEEALKLQNELVHVLRKGGFELHKWSSNNTRILENVPAERREAKLSLAMGKNSVKALGLTWKTQEDQLAFSINMKNYEPSETTKRTILSEVASIFDPLGILGPIVTKAKIFIQQLWKEKSNWDEPLSNTLATEWSEMRTELNQFKDFTVDRLITQRDRITNVQIHGFSDASEVAYGACVYLRTETENGNIHTELITSKSKVAPIKQITLPRLELCGALILARLINKVKSSLHLQIDKTYLWSDSTIVLSWLKSLPTRWKTFVANRVSEIQELTEDNCSWNHVQSQDNPADKLSRGQTVNVFIENQTAWIHGPTWINLEEIEWPTQTLKPTAEDSLPEIKITKISHICIHQFNLLEKFSSFSRLQRTFAYCLRFIASARNPNTRQVGPLTTEELNKTLTILVKQVQHEEFEKEITLLQANQPVTKSKLLPLNPFLDDNKVLRVGGRLRNANLTFAQTHPIILPAKHTFTKLIIEYEHKRILHGGTQATLASLRQKFWPLHGRSTTRKIVHSCNNCFRFHATNIQPIMGDLPKYRTESIRPFAHTGIDYAGPLSIKKGVQRRSATVKAYIALFICLNTRAIHLEAVSNLTTEAFLGALKRFIARRGKCLSIHSDNATNFKGANNELKELFKLFNSSRKTEIIDFAVSQGIQWNFIPPHSPNFGGIWEAGVKSMKNHLKRTIGNTILTFEEFQTLLCQIEACLNSRPLIPMSDDPTDSLILTPAHFLIGNSLTAIPEPDLAEIRLSHLSRWQLIQQQLQSFWRHWSKEYLQHMQQRTKWKKSTPDIHIGTLVLVKEDNQPPLNWARGRVLQVHKGTDNCVRVVSVKTKDGVIKRPVNKLCLLPMEAELK